MKILFLALSKFESYDVHGIYTDLLRTLIKEGHSVFSVVSNERRNKEKTRILNDKNDSFICVVKTFNIQKTNIIEKGIGTLLINYQFKKAIKRYYKNIKFDLVLYPTPPITLYGVIKYVKKRDNARSYLMLKDIFPQNSIDLGLLSKKGLKGILYRYFRKKEKKFYMISDTIGCMSEANVDYLIKHNPELKKDKIEVFPNCIEAQDLSLNESDTILMRTKYGLPLDKIIFVYGGNLGAPQGIPFVLSCLSQPQLNAKAFFLIVGDGTDYANIENFINSNRPVNVRLMRKLPKEDYDRMIASCDVGMIFLDYRFTIPNYPSRLLSYMQANLPILACTDSATDIGSFIVRNRIGWSCESNNVLGFVGTIDLICSDLSKKNLLNPSFQILKNAYSVDIHYKKILEGK